MSHTPGPWKWRYDITDPYSLDGPHGEEVISARDGASYSEYTTDTATIALSSPANAFLIAAAPEMLAALQDIIARNEIQHWFNLDMARAAVVKATTGTAPSSAERK